jgi:hypothetical protein
MGLLVFPRADGISFALRDERGRYVRDQWTGAVRRKRLEDLTPSEAVALQAAHVLRPSDVAALVARGVLSPPGRAPAVALGSADWKAGRRWRTR